MSRRNPLHIGSIIVAVAVLLVAGGIATLLISAGKSPKNPAGPGSSGTGAPTSFSSDAEQKTVALRLLSEGKYLSALPVLKDYLDRHAGDVEVRQGYAQTLWLSGKYDASLAEYKRVLLSSPPDPELNYRVAVILRQTGDKEQSLAYLQRAVKLAPTNPVFRFELAKAYQMTGNDRAGIKEIKQAIKSAPPLGQFTGTLYAELGAAYQKADDIAGAKKAYRLALKADPGNKHFESLLKEVEERR